MIWLFNVLYPFAEKNHMRIQLQKIESDLQAARTGTSADPTWLLVVGHHPLFSPGRNGDTVELQHNLMPLLEKYSADAYFCGHDHMSAHMR